MKQKIGFSSIIKIVKHYWLFVLVIVIVSGIVGYFNTNLTKEYEAVSRFYVVRGFAIDSNGNSIRDDDNDRFWQSINEITKTDMFKEQMTKRYDSFSEHSLNVSSFNGTNVVTVKYQDKNMQKSIDITNYASRILRKDISKFNEITDPTITLIDQANKKTTSTIVLGNRKSHALMYAFYALLIGLILSSLHFIHSKKAIGRG